MFDVKNGYFTQVVGRPQAKLSEPVSKNDLSDAYMYSAYLSHSQSSKLFTIFDPKTDKMYRLASVIDRKTPMQKEYEMAIAEKKRSVETIP